jgi:peptide-methionine (R)-S-oxide reductase
VKRLAYIAGLVVATSAAWAAGPNAEGTNMTQEVARSEEQWCRELTPEEYKVLRQKGTERAFSGKYWNNHEKGVYRCAGCGAELFRSDTKFDSGTGWPSFSEPMDPENVKEVPDLSHGMVRTEVLCGKCGGHLGHVFEDGPRPTGMRYCINSVSLEFEEKE